MTEEPETPSYTAPPRERFGADDNHDGEGERHYHVSELVLTQAEVESTMKTVAFYVLYCFHICFLFLFFKKQSLGVVIPSDLTLLSYFLCVEL